MTNNRIPEKFSSQKDLSPRLGEITTSICVQTGFVLGEELQRRFIYEREKTWRVKYEGRYQDRTAVLVVIGMQTEEDEERIRRVFRAQASGSRVRPPETFVSEAFDEKKGYGFLIEERVFGPMLYAPNEDPAVASKAFAAFYRELRKGIRDPFWSNDHGDARAFSMKQLDSWEKVAEEKQPGFVQRFRAELDKLREGIAKGMEGRELRFMHAHSCGPDVRIGDDGSYIIFANPYWSWRQPSYDLAFPIWHQWMHLPVGKRSAADVEHVTRIWMETIACELSDLVDLDALRAMLLNRVFGSLILDLPAKAKLAPETEATVAPMFEAFLQEGKRLLS